MPKPVERAQRYMPGLDGLRALAVLAVIAYHLQPGWAQGGLLGVGVFFTLSGYLITDLLLGQRDAVGHLRLGNFWLRRARRLLPALFLMLAVVVAWVTLLDRSQLPALRGDVLAAALYVSNWWNIFRHASYFSNFGPPPPLDHLWSLAVEEQFYLVWPFLLWLGLRYVRGRYRLAGLTLVGAALSATVMALLYQPGVDPTRVYEGTDTRAFGLLVGAALAMVWPSRRLGAGLSVRRRLLLDGAGVVGLVVIALLIWRTDQYSVFLYRGGMVLLSVATVLVVAALAHPASWLGPALGWKPLRWLGVRSYGIYLWHWPIIVLTTPTEQRGVNLSLGVLQVGATIAVAALSWRFVEEPIRRGALGRFWAQARSGVWRRRAVPRQAVPRRTYRRRRRQRLAAGVASVGALSVLTLDVVGLAGVISIGAGGSGSPPLSERVPAEIKISAHHAPAAPPTTAASPETSSSRAASATRTPAPSPETSPPKSAPQKTGTPKAASATRTSCQAIAYIGDSTSAGMVMPSYLPDPDLRLDAQFARVGATNQYIEISRARSIVETLSGQANAEEVARQLVTNGFQGCWVFALGTNDTANIYAGSTVGRMTRIKQMMSVVGDQPVVWVNLKSLLASGPYSEANMELWNRTLEQACTRYPNMRIFDWASLANDSWFISDGTHYTSAGYAQRARLTADSLAHAFPASGREGDPGCVVR
ncbi:MAG: acyltransferase family protein [Actinomycetota bacterium]|nr:acyltransferase family protein [Actinomycetota bacterium]